jgi:glutathione S-transferase
MATTAGGTTAKTGAAVKLFYLDKRVKGESIRLALVVGDVDFEDARVSYEEVARMRADKTLPFSHVPAMQLGDDPVLHTQSQALLRWAGRRGGLYPEEHQLRIDTVTEVVDDLYVELIKVGYGAAMCRHPETGRPMVPLSQAQRAEVARSNGEVLFPVRFSQLERLLGHAPGGPYFCGATLTIADLSFYVLASAILDGAWIGNGVEPEVLDGCEGLLNIVKLVGNHPRVAAWNAAHPTKWFG